MTDVDILKLAEGVCINEVVIAFKSHPLSLVKCSREELHAIKPLVIRGGRRMPVRVAHRAATCDETLED